jgi:hypothetical protein
MRFYLPIAVGLVCMLIGTADVAAQTLLFDFEGGAQDWESFGSITTDFGTDDGSSGLGRYHSGDFSIPNSGNFGIADMSPAGQDLSTFGGLSVDARFVDDPFGDESFVGVRELDISVVTGEGAGAEEFFAPKQTMNEFFFNPIAVQFSQFKSSLDQQPPSAAELANARIKFVVLNANGTGDGRFEYDEIKGLAPAGVQGDYNNNGVVDAGDYVLWRRGGPLENEVDVPGVVNQADYAAWRARFGNTSGSGSMVGATIPEPATCCLTLAAMVGTLALRRRAA